MGQGSRGVGFGPRQRCVGTARRSLLRRRPSAASARTTRTPAPATAKLARGLSVAVIDAAREEADARRGAGRGLEHRDDPGLVVARAVSSWTALTSETHWTPLPMPPMTAAAQAIARLGAAAVAR